MESPNSYIQEIASSNSNLDPRSESFISTGQRSVDSSSLYASLPLDSTISAIRLLTLQPAQWNSPLQAEMQTASLTDHPLYDTLSYVWGQEKPQEYSQSIRINETDVAISHSLFDALQDVRLHNGNSPLTIWVDALCIDQTSITEKNQQIPLMGKIYSYCQNVHIAVEGIEKYLFVPGEARLFTGGDDDYVAHWDEYIKHFNFKDDSHKKSSIFSPSQHYRFDIFMAWIFRELADANHLTDVSAFLPVLQSHNLWCSQMKHAAVTWSLSDWFQRLWIVQEAALAPAGRVYFGSISMPLHMMITASLNYCFHIQKGCCPVSGFNRNAIDENFIKICDQFVSLNTLRRDIARTSSLLELSLLFMKRKASVTHDLVYALLGLTHSNIRPDYKSDLKALFTEVSVEHILSSDNLLPLSFGRFKSSIHDLPTWAVDLQLHHARGHPNPPWLDWFTQIPNFNTCGDLIQGTSLEINHSQLHLAGIEFDRIVAISPTIHEYAKTGILESLSYYDISLSLSHQKDHIDDSGGVIAKTESDVYPGGSTWKNAWWRTLLRDHCWGSAQNQKASDRHICTLRALVRYLKEAEFGDADELFNYISHISGIEDTLFTGVDRVSDELLVETIRTHLFWQTMDQKLFMTEKGFLGMANKDILVQDMVFILPSSSVPIILRPVQSLNEFETSIYSNVGDCYVHGIMAGNIAAALRHELRRVIIV
jgi:hypothetical protein